MINLSWNFNELMKHIEALKSQYKIILASFSYFQLKKEVAFVYQTRQKIYSLKFEKYKREKIWEYLNDYILIDELNKYLEDK